jgi:hypothetical protein
MRLMQCIKANLMQNHLSMAVIPLHLALNLLRIKAISFMLEIAELPAYLLYFK